jgi:uncharacterized protein YigA (DUF484 family)
LQFAASLFTQADPLALPEVMAQDIAARFSVPQVAIKVWGVSPAYADCDFAQGASEDAQSFAASLPEPFCGVNTGLEVANWLADPQAAASLAILPLRASGAEHASTAFGLMVLASPDAQRFNSTMGVDFLGRIAELASAALSRLR